MRFDLASSGWHLTRLSIFREAMAIAIVAAMLSIAWTMALGPDISFDFLSYHLYIGMHARGDTLANNYFPAGVSSYLLPYAHWPLSAMIAAHWPAKVVGALWSALQSTAALATWIVAYALFPGPATGDRLLRILGTVLGCLSPLALAAIGSSHVDLITSIPIVVGLAIVLIHIHRPEANFGWMLAAGGCIGAATALKLTNATMALAAAIVVIAVWVIRRDVPGRTVLAFMVGCIAGALLTYGYWGWLLWREFGNPMFPFFDSMLHPAVSVISQSGMSVTKDSAPLLDRILTFRNSLHQRFLPHGWTEWLLRPLYMVDPMPNAYVEVRSPDVRFLALLLLGPLALLLVPRPPAGQPRTGRALGVLLAFFGMGFLLWMMLFGNGRYMLTLALVSGPALVECVRRLLGRWPRRVIVGVTLLVGLQIVCVMEGRFRWGESTWQTHWLEASLPALVTSRPATFVVFNGIPASWLTLFVHPASRFLSPDAMPTRIRLAARLPKLLAEADSLIAVFVYGSVDDASGQPVPATPKALGPIAERFGVVVDFDACETGPLSVDHPNATLVESTGADGRVSRRRMVSGYFFCPARYDSSVTAAPLNPLVEAAFDNLERACEREMPPGFAETMCTVGGCFRHYPTTDVSVTIDAKGNASFLRYGGFDRPFLGNAIDLAQSADAVDCRSDLGRYKPFDPGGNLLSRSSRPLNNTSAPPGR